ncbi:MAG: radical SAM protein [Nannocystaceae bacterium]
MVTSRPAPEHRRVALLAVAACDNRCLFCCREGLDAPAVAADALAAGLDEARARADEVTFVGGEPSLLGDGDGLVRAVAAARERGFRAVGIQSHGRHLAALVDRLVDAGLSDLHLSIHGDSAAVHDYHVGVDGAFAAVGKTLAAARRRGLEVAVTTVLTRSNLRNLAALPGWLRERGAAAWCVAVPAVAGGARRRFEAVVPRLGVAIPHALRALELARKRRLPAWIAGAPHCLLGPYRGLALADDPARSYAAACTGCEARASCPGLDPIYLARFHGDEVRPDRLSPAQADATSRRERDRLRRLFVGPGALAIGGRSLATIVDPPRSAGARQRQPQEVGP